MILCADEGDKVTFNNNTWVSDFDNNTGNTPNIYGWTEYLPYVEMVDPTYKTLEELYPETETEETPAQPEDQGGVE